MLTAVATRRPRSRRRARLGSGRRPRPERSGRPHEHARLRSVARGPEGNRAGGRFRRCVRPGARRLLRRLSARRDDRAACGVRDRTAPPRGTDPGAAPGIVVRTALVEHPGSARSVRCGPRSGDAVAFGRVKRGDGSGRRRGRRRAHPATSSPSSGRRPPSLRSSAGSDARARSASSSAEATSTFAACSCHAAGGGLTIAEPRPPGPARWHCDARTPRGRGHGRRAGPRARARRPRARGRPAWTDEEIARFFGDSYRSCASSTALLQRRCRARAPRRRGRRPAPGRRHLRARLRRRPADRRARARRGRAHGPDRLAAAARCQHDPAPARHRALPRGDRRQRG